jgi:hypothetical protein
VTEFDPLERELAAMRPRGMRPELLEGLMEEVGKDAARRGAWGDRFLIGAIGSGLAASVVIVVMLSVQTGGAPPEVGAGGAVPVAAGDGRAAVGDYPVLFARAGGRWDDVVR